MKIKAALGLLLIQLAVSSCQKEHKTAGNESAAVAGDSITVTKKADREDKIDYTNFNIYSISIISSAQKDVLADAFISVSDIYTDPHSIQEDIFKNQKNTPFEQMQRIELDSKHRQKMLDGLHLSENDSLYLYNYQSNTLRKTPLHKLKAVAYLDAYSFDSDELESSYYMVGFQVATQEGNDVDDKYNNAVAYFGNKNPFVEGKMKAIPWKKTGADIAKKYFTNSKLKSGNSYQAQYENMTYYLQDYLEGEILMERKLAIVNDRHEKIFEKTISMAGTDGAEFSPLNGIDTDESNGMQWTGYLFKGKPPVVLGFLAQSFGCPSITFLDKNEKPMVINCDNRH
ncbi:hypothetical protein [Chryseobacterium pennipullorum]|uniref:Uncharacterized protein n=1 Tax=Chryseobacterium pennipullorum TaxID=2258963 RepID=A0A3D9ATZ9_9FLAO|nr:hypothetical protein [Chryseobacterium pennipullorum]REC44632.1 hypothetical protein DRF67_17420 [Chryseobacterium pennipullorum]